MKTLRISNPNSAALLLLGSAFFVSAAQAEFYLGGSLGSATVALDPDIVDFDESDESWKFFGGYQFDFSVIEFGIEASYLDLGKPESGLGSIDMTAIDLFAVFGFDFAFVGIFGKAGMVSWDSDFNDGGFQYSDDGTDSAYGAGLKFDIADKFEIRVEYELFDIEDTDDVNMISAGVAWHF